MSATKRFEGFHEHHTLPIEKGDLVTIPKGTMVCSTKPGANKPASRTYTVKVFRMSTGASDTKHEVIYPEDGSKPFTKTVTVPFENPKVVWVGSGGYWHEADINDIPEALEPR